MRLGSICATLSLAMGLSTAPALAQSASELMGSADPAKGERAFRQCKACHTVESGGPNRVGPNLYGIVGGSVAAVDGFKYSPALSEFGGEWSVERLDAFLEDPRKAVPGTRMGFRGISDPADRADMIAYLNSNSDAPMTFEGGGESSASAEPAEEDFGALVAGEGVDVVFYSCTACHSEMIVVQQGKTRHDWDKMLDWMVEEQGMSEPSAEDRTVILDYLETHYNTDRPNFPKN